MSRTTDATALAEGVKMLETYVCGIYTWDDAGSGIWMPWLLQRPIQSQDGISQPKATKISRKQAKKNKSTP